jgi:large subunit ribosomal protein L15
MANLNEVKRTSEKRAYRRVGRGHGSGRGKQSGRGGKGQTARAGHKVRPEFRDIIKKLPKRRGFGKNRARTVNASIPDAVAISLAKLDTHFESAAEVSPATLREKGLIGRRSVPVKIVLGREGVGQGSKKFVVKGCAISASARAALEKLGGTIL